MKSSSDHYPELVISSNGKIQVRYNIVETKREDMEGSSMTVYDFDYVEIEGEVTKDKIVDAIVLAETPPQEIIVPIEKVVIPPKPIDTKMVETAIIEAKSAIAKKIIPIK